MNFPSWTTRQHKTRSCIQPFCCLHLQRELHSAFTTSTSTHTNTNVSKQYTFTFTFYSQIVSVFCAVEHDDISNSKQNMSCMYVGGGNGDGDDFKSFQLWIKLGLIQISNDAMLGEHSAQRKHRKWIKNEQRTSRRWYSLQREKH